MKQFRIAVKSILACAVVALAASCGDKAAATASDEAAGNDSLAAPAGCRIAYFDADSVMRSYALAQQLNEEGQRLSNSLQQFVNAKQRELETQAQNIEHKRQNNIYLSEASFQNEVQALQRAQATAEQQINTRQQQAQITLLQSQQRVTDSIAAVASALSGRMGYDAILLKETGIYFNPTLDVTSQIIEELNRRFNAGSPAAAQ